MIAPDVPDAVVHMSPILRGELIEGGLLADDKQASFAANSVVGRDHVWTEVARVIAGPDNVMPKASRALPH